MKLRNEEVVYLTFGQRFKEIREKKGLTQMDIAKHLDLSISAIHHWEHGTRFPLAVVLPKLSNLLGVSTDYLLGLTDRETGVGKYSAVNTREYVPVLGNVSAGIGLPAKEEILYTMPKFRDEDFDLIVRGNSMYPLYKDGEIALIRRQPRPDRDGQPSLVRINGNDAVIKRFYQQSNGVLLKSDNPDYEDTFIDRYKWDSECEFIGVIVGSVHLERE